MRSHDCLSRPRVTRRLGGLLLSLALVPCLALGDPITAGRYRIDWHTEPTTVPVGKAKIVLSVKDDHGRSVEGAAVYVIAQMPGMPMGEREQRALPGKGGAYAAPAVFAMEGAYDLSVRIDGPLGSGQGKTSVQTGDDTGSDSERARGGPFSLFIGSMPVFGIIAGLAFALWLFVRSGLAKREAWVRFKSAILPLGLIGACVIAAFWAVNKYRRPGSMTPLEAQVMQMDAPPPEGVTPVTLARVELGPVLGTVRYSGQAVGYAEQDVFPRVTGTLVYMPFYAGDKIHKGQVLARLDRSQLTPQTEQQRAQLSASQMGVQASDADFRAASAMVVEASSEEGQYHAAIQEAEANLQAAQANLEAQNAMATSAEAEIRDFQAQQASAQADSDFAQADADRAKKLLEAGAISRSEFQKRDADAKKSVSNVAAMLSSVHSMEAKALAAKAQARSAQAMVLAAKHKLEQANNEMHVHMAHVTTAKATADSAKSKIEQAVANAQQAAAGLAAATANEGYSTIVSPFDGVVTQRLLSPGTLLQPGMSILKVAQISPIRLQANVASIDLSRIRVGTLASVLIDGRKVATAKITSVAPSIDSASRTGTVEAILPNADRVFSPGQFLSFEIVVSGSNNVLHVPMDAVQSGPSDVRFVWLATPTGEENRYTVKRVLVAPTVSDGTRCGIEGQVNAGDRVVLSGFGNLVDGVTVMNQEKGNEQ